jgi:hypothetical protein
VSQVTFKGFPAATLIKELPPMQRGIGKLLMMKEGQYGRSHMTCLQDTLVALVPKAMISRSKTELSEVGFLEVLESLLIYYSVPLIGGKAFNKLFGALLPKEDRGLLTKTIKEIPKTKLRSVLPAKAGIIITALTLTGIGGEYIINYARNLMTAQVFKKDKFSDVVNLSKGTIKTGEKSSVVEKSRHRIYQVLGICGGLLTASMLGARYGPKIMSDGFVKGPLKSMVRFFDFQFHNGSYGLTKNQMGTYMALSVPAYLDSARDKLETWESATRLGIVLPYLLWGQDWIESLIREKFPLITRDAGSENGANRVLSLEELAQEATERALEKKRLCETAFQELPAALKADVLQDAAKEFQAPLRAKALHVGIPLAVGVLGTGIGIGLLNRYFTKYRFEQQNKEQHQQNHTFIAPPLGNIMPPFPWQTSSFPPPLAYHAPPTSRQPQFVPTMPPRPLFQQHAYPAANSNPFTQPSGFFQQPPWSSSN